MFKNLKSQVGQIMPITLLVTGLGALSVGAMLGIINSASRASGTFQDTMKAHYAAAAGIDAVMADLLQGADALSPGYVKPSVALNEHTVTISISSPLVNLTPRAIFRYIDPGAGQGLASLAPAATWSVKLNGAQPASSLFVNWSFITGDIPNVEVRVLDAAGKRIAISSKPQLKDTPATLMTRLGSGDVFTVEFENKDIGPIMSRDFSARGGRDHTWVLVKSTGKDYLITTTAVPTANPTTGGGIVLKAYIRQIPGPGPNSPPIKQTVVVESWQGPFAPPTPPPGP